MFDFQFAVKLYHVRYIDKFHWLIQFIENLYKIHIKTESLERSRYFNTFSLFTEYFFKGFIVIYVSTFAIILAYPLYINIARNELVPILEIFIPGIDETTRSGYIILTLYQSALFYIALFGVCACDFLIAIIIINSVMLAKLFSFEVQQLHVDLEGKETTIALKYRLRNILLLHQGINE